MLKNTFIYFRYIQPICLPNAAMTSRSFIGERPVALGWGSTHYGGAEVGTLRGVDLPVWSQRECDDAYFQVLFLRRKLSDIINSNKTTETTIDSIMFLFNI